jgi:hypothetical protein
MADPQDSLPEIENSSERLFTELDGRPTDGPPARVLGNPATGGSGGFGSPVGTFDEHGRATTVAVRERGSRGGGAAAMARAGNRGARIIHAMCLL